MVNIIKMYNRRTVFYSFSIFKILNNIDKLITPILSTEELMNTQFYDKVEECRTLYYTKKSHRRDEYNEKLNNSYHIFFDFETITSGESACLIYLKFIMMIYSNNV